jgi:sterol desaturase/sphingolipid hydroxylase (fatty acid hydroxylase superfamily)
MSDGFLFGWLPLSVFAWAVQMVVFHSFGLAFEWSDRAGWMRNAKIRNVGRRRYSELLSRVLANQIFVLLPAMVAVQWAGLAFSGPAHLSPLRFVIDMLLLGVGHDIVQYATHRFLLHRPDFVRTLRHGLHHSTGASQAISACYMSTADFFLEIVLPYLVPLVVIGGGGADVLFHALVVGLGALGGLYEHSGYDFAVPLQRTRFFSLRPKSALWLAGAITSHAHGEHHRRNGVSFSDGFGSPGLCDTLFGTRWDKTLSAPPSGDPAKSAS